MKTSLLGLFWTLLQVGSTGDHKAENHLKFGRSVWQLWRPILSQALCWYLKIPKWSTPHCCPLGLRKPPLMAQRHGACRCSTLSQPSKKAAWKTWPLSKNAPEAHWPNCYIRTTRHFRDVVFKPLPRTKEFEFLEMQHRHAHFLKNHVGRLW